MDDWTFRPPTREDAQAVLDLLVRCDIADYGEPDSDLEDLLHEWDSVDLRHDAWLACDPAGDLIGYAVVVPWWGGLRYMFCTAPEVKDLALGAALLARCEARGRAQVAAGAAAKATTYLANVNARDQQIAAAAGFRPTRYHFQMRIHLGAEVPEPAWPNGIAVRTAEAGRDDRAVYALIQAAFDRPGREPQSYESWQSAMLREDIFDPTLWFLAFAGEELAGACLGFAYPSGGWIRQLGVAAAWRRKGLATALLQYAFREFQRRGENRIGLGVAGDNPNAYTLYEKAGMQRARQYDEYTKPIE